jgi:hypothetical protein
MELQSGRHLPMRQSVSDCGRVVVCCFSGQSRLWQRLSGKELHMDFESAEPAPEEIWKWVA